MSNGTIVVNGDHPAPAKSNEVGKVIMRKDEPRQPIAVEKLLITHANPHGVKLPDGLEGKGEKMRHTLSAGVEGDVMTKIDLLPWVHSFRVIRSNKVSRTEKQNGKDVEVVTWRPMGKPFFIHQTWCVWIPAEQ